MKKLFYILMMAFMPLCLSAKVWIPKIFSSGMIMQRKDHVRLWGNALPNSKVVIASSWARTIELKTDNEGNWKTVIKTTDNRNNQTLTITDNESKVELNDILFGEVWLCGGQSNMAWKVIQPLKNNRKIECKNAKDMIVSSQKHQIHFFTVGKGASDVPRNDVTGEWIKATPETTADCSAVAYSFAEKLSEELQVPIGLVISAVGGSRIEAWINKENNQLVEIPKELLTSKKLNKKPYGLYNAMIYPIQGFGIKGVIYYQGESNRDDADRYSKLFPILIKQWRQNWNKELSFYYAQIAPYDYETGESYKIREVQKDVANTITKTGIAITLDVGEKKSIHPKNKRPVGNRLALLALKKNYNKHGIKAISPQIRKVKLVGRKIELTFDENIFLHGHDEFTISGSNHKFYQAEVKQLGPKKILVFSTEVEVPSIVRYAYSDWCTAQIFNSTGLPVSSFEYLINSDL
ncbi:sialate O-acetylesterase [Halosquirtibacter xylanolyticus]|uniref:sialate O-acetylesterase n=1 Tax=Halosquirtibacter xylanolyticus TaxID=3374599 RepID=UPI0037491955|nr:sialate O-acetylesterase [Prolixibacteraceae bacterium]